MLAQLFRRIFDYNIFQINNAGVVTVKNGGDNLSFPFPYYTITVAARNAAGLYSPPANFKIYPTLYGTEDGPDWSTVSQDANSDCWFISALVELAHDDPGEVDDMITQGDGPLDFTVDLWTPFTGWDPVSVDLLDDEGNWATYTDCNGFWAGLFEQAYLDVGGSLDANFTGAAIPILTGQPYNSFSIHNEQGQLNFTECQIYNDIGIWRNLENGLLIASTPSNLDVQGLVAGHAYSVMGVDTVDNVRYVELRNPWGNRDTDHADTWGSFSITLTSFVTNFAEIAYQDEWGGGEQDTALVDASPNAPVKPSNSVAVNPTLNAQELTNLGFVAQNGRANSAIANVNPANLHGDAFTATGTPPVDANFSAQSLENVASEPGFVVNKASSSAMTQIAETASSDALVGPVMETTYTWPADDFVRLRGAAESSAANTPDETLVPSWPSDSLAGMDTPPVIIVSSASSETFGGLDNGLAYSLVVDGTRDS